jgi:hypothetical protein
MNLLRLLRTWSLYALDNLCNHSRTVAFGLQSPHCRRVDSPASGFSASGPDLQPVVRTAKQLVKHGKLLANATALSPVMDVANGDSFNRR